LAVAKQASAGLSDAANAMVVRGETMLGRDDRPGAIQAFEKAIALAPKATALHLMVAALEETSGDYDRAIGRYRQVLELQPGNIVALNNLAYSLGVRQNQPAEALPLARKAASLAPRSGAILDTLGWIEHLLGNHEVAAGIFQDAVRFSPTEPEVRLHAAVVYAAAGRGEEAKKELEEALKLDPGLETREEVQKLRNKLPPERP
jgi:tetratricopeptide (TPR) repeat protein